MPTYFNATFGPLVWNDKGQIIGGGEWLVADPTPEIEALLASSEMVLVTQPVEEKEEKPRTRRSKKQENTQE